MASNLMQATGTLIAQGFLVYYVYLLTEFREPRALWLRRWLVGAVLITLANLLLILLAGYSFYLRWFPLTVTLWHVALILLVSRYRGARTLFNLLTVLNMAGAGILNGLLLQRFCGGEPLANWLGRLGTYLVLLGAVKHLRLPYLHMLGLLDHGWHLLCAFPLVMTVFLYVYALSAPFVQLDPFVCLCAELQNVIFYCVVWLFFQRVLQQDMARQDKELLAVQVASMRRRLEAVQSAEEQMRIERHDLRHRLRTLAALLEKSDKAAALEYIGASQAHLDRLRPMRHCQNPVIDAVLDTYLRHAEAVGIQVETRLAIPDELPVDAVELSTVLANALENAINACRALPEQERRIVLTGVCHPSLMLEIANTCGEAVRFDESGRPAPQEHGHGMGTRSIAAFVEKHAAWCAYEQKDGWFRFLLAFDEEHAPAQPTPGANASSQ